MPDISIYIMPQGTRRDPPFSTYILLTCLIIQRLKPIYICIIGQFPVNLALNIFLSFVRIDFLLCRPVPEMAKLYERAKSYFHLNRIYFNSRVERFVKKVSQRTHLGKNQFLLLHHGSNLFQWLLLNFIRQARNIGNVVHLIVFAQFFCGFNGSDPHTGTA